LLAKGDARFDGMRELFSGQKYCPSLLTDAEISVLQRLQDKALLSEEMPAPARLNFPTGWKGA